MKAYLELISSCFKMGCLAFGGGYAVIPLVERELVKKRGWVTFDEVIDYYTIAQITPGIISVNLCTFVGYKQKGVPGGIIATTAFVFPGATLIILLAAFISNFADLPVVQHAFAGIRIAVGALILDTVIKMVKGALKGFRALALYLIAFTLSVFPRGILPSLIQSPMVIVLAAGLAGLVLYREKKGALPKGDGADAGAAGDEEGEK